MTATVDFSSAPTASTVRGDRNGNAMGSGAYPRERRSSWRRVPVARSTESSQRMWISRSWVSRPSTIGPSRVAASPSSCAIGSSLLFPLVITSGRPTPATSRWWSGE